VKKVGRLGGEKCKRGREMEKGYLTLSVAVAFDAPPSSSTSPKSNGMSHMGGPIEAVPGLASFRELGPPLFGSGTSTGQASFRLN